MGVHASHRIIIIIVLLLIPVVDIVAAGGFLSSHNGGVSRRSSISPPSSLEDLLAGTIRTRKRATWTEPVSPPSRSSRWRWRPRIGSSSTFCRAVLRDGAATAGSSSRMVTQRRFYDYDGVTCSYEYLCNSATTKKKKKKKKVLLLIHPVGIGMANWFWDKFLEEIIVATTTDNDDYDWIDDVYAINLIGCGRSRQSGVVDDEYFLARTSDVLDKKKKRPTAQQEPPMMLLPWTRQCAYFVDEIILKPDDDSTSTTTEITVISQGGLAPVALQLAASLRPMIANVILASPPTLQELRTSLSIDEAVRNWDWLRQLPDWAFRNLLETKGAIQFFSNLFLFDRPCDRVWIDQARTECDRSVRAAVRYFNAGMCEVPSVDIVVAGGVGANMTTTTPPPRRVLVVRGAKDRRIEKDDFTKTIVIPNANKVVPWEAPGAFLAAVQSFLQQEDHDGETTTTTTTTVE
jgi:pimeloyl-ACP methyl ester carboxylesterase